MSRPRKLYYMIWLSLMDWSKQIDTKSILESIRASYPTLFNSLDTGIVFKGKRRSVYRASIQKHLHGIDEWEKCEWFGKASCKEDPEREWESYLSIDTQNGGHLIACSSLKEFSLDSLPKFVFDLATLGQLGYGYGGKSDRSGLIYYICGITHGIPNNQNEKLLAMRLSRWFRERLSMAGEPPKKRYLSGMFRDAYSINVLNNSQVEKDANGCIFIKGSPETIGQLTSINNDTYVWIIPKSELKATEQLLNKNNLLI
jgi:hypothetical protein